MGPSRPSFGFRRGLGRRRVLVKALVKALLMAPSKGRHKKSPPPGCHEFSRHRRPGRKWRPWMRGASRRHQVSRANRLGLPRCFGPGVSSPVFRSRCFCPIAKNSTAAMAPSFRGPARGVRSAAPGRFSPGPGLGRAPSPDRLLPVGLVTPPHQCLAVFLSNSRLFSPPVIIAAGNYHRRFQRFLFVFRRKMARRQDFYFIAAWSYDRKLCSDER